MSINPLRSRQHLIQPINTGSILSDARLDDQLIGRPAPNLRNGLATTSAFMRRHQFLSSSPHDGDASNSGLARMYGPAIDEFQRAQMERQAAGLRTNTSGASAAAVERVIDCHADALRHGLDSVDAGAEVRVCRVHAKLCPDIERSGQYRLNRVRTSASAFIPPEDIEREFDKGFGPAVKRLQMKWAISLTAIMSEDQWCEKVYQQIGIAALLLFGISDIHPFQDGNGRTARISMNIMLKRYLGLPFPVTITATQQQRRDYVYALKQCRSRLHIISKKQRSSSRGRSNPVLGSLIEVVIDRVLHAVVQFNSLIESKTQAAAVDEKAKIARQVRESAAEGLCAICLDDQPNISTLCCGQVVHMTCLAEWLSNRGSCIGCRKPMPRLVQRQQGEDRNGNAGGAANDDRNNAGETPEGNNVESVTEQIARALANMEIVQNDETESSAENTTEAADDRVSANDQGGAAEDTTEETTEDSTTEDFDAQWPAPPSSVFCGQCQTNRFAVDCTNGLCGRCCQLHGRVSCARHNC